MTTGGSVEEITYAGRIFAVAADSDPTVKLGGFENEVQPNGNGTARKIMKRMQWSASGLAVEMDDTRGDQEFLQERADGKVYEDFTIKYVSGEIYQGVGTPTGEIARSAQSATSSMNFEGPGKLTRQ